MTTMIWRLILEIKIDRPLIIAGLPRSGTTHLVNWLARDSRYDQRAVPRS